MAVYLGVRDGLVDVTGSLAPPFEQRTQQVVTPL